MHILINTPWQLGSLTLPNRLIQGPLAGYSCAPFRELFYEFTPPAYTVSEMCSAANVVTKDTPQSRYLYRAPKETVLAYQISGTDSLVMAKAAHRLESLGADIIDINCGCPKTKIRKKGAGSALLEDVSRLIDIVASVRETIRIPLTVKMRLLGNDSDITLAQKMQHAGADALIVHGRRWHDDYDIPCNFAQIAQIKRHVAIPVIANGDIRNSSTLEHAIRHSECDAFMIARAGTGSPQLYQELLEGRCISVDFLDKIALFVQHLEGLARLESEFKAILQSKSLVRYYFRDVLDKASLQQFYTLSSIKAIEHYLSHVPVRVM